MVSHSAVQVGRPITDLVLDHGETSFFQYAFASRTCNTQSFITLLFLVIIQQKHTSHVLYLEFRPIR